jgi:hypothetical protein
VIAARTLQHFGQKTKKIVARRVGRQPAGGLGAGATPGHLVPRKDAIEIGTRYNRSSLGLITEIGSRWGCARATELAFPPFGTRGKETGAPLPFPPLAWGAKGWVIRGARPFGIARVPLIRESLQIP